MESPMLSCMSRERNAVKTYIDPEGLFAALKAIKPDLQLKSLALLMAQWALETGRGKSCICYNIGNFKALPSRDWTYFTTWERLPQKLAMQYVDESTESEPAEYIKQLDTGAIIVKFKPRHPMAKFCAYESLQDGVKDYVGQLEKRFVEAWQAVQEGDANKFIGGLLHGHYFTGSPLVYADSIFKLAREYEKQFA